MLQSLTTYGTQAALLLGYLSGAMTCVSGVVAVFGASDTKFGHAVAAFGLDVAKLYRLVTGVTKGSA